MQFTLKQLLVAVALIAIGIGGVTLPWRANSQTFTELPVLVQILGVAYWLSSGTVLGAGLGMLFDRVRTGAILGCLAWTVLGIWTSR